jgi:hypothetical protein
MFRPMRHQALAKVRVSIQGVLPPFPLSPHVAVDDTAGGAATLANLQQQLEIGSLHIEHLLCAAPVIFGIYTLPGTGLLYPIKNPIASKRSGKAKIPQATKSALF